MKKFLLFSSLLAIALPSYALDKSDAGEYVLLNLQQQPTPTQMRFYQRGTQWVMDGKHGDAAWQSICHGDGKCRLQAAKPSDVRAYQAMLPQKMRTNPLSCIQNVAFAFCRMNDGTNDKRRLYWWFPLTPESARGHAFGLNRVH